MSNAVIQAQGLTKYFGRKCAVDQVSLSVPAGTVYALLGRNGSGKSTLMRMVMGLLEPTRGRSTVLGADSQHLPDAVRGRVGFIAEGHPLIDAMRVRDLRAFQQHTFTRWNGKLFAATLEHFAIGEKARPGQLSRGQRAGLSLALTMATEPELLVMDDPALGLDPVARRTLLEAMILLTRDAGHTIFFSSHVLDDVERVADHLAIIDRSVLRVACSLETFGGRVKRLLLTFADRPPALPAIPGLLQATRDGHELRLTLANPTDQTSQTIAGLGALSTTELPVTLEDAVIGYLGDRGEQSSLLQKTAEVLV